MKSRFIALNYALSRALDHVWAYPLATSFWEEYATRAAELATKADPPRIVDIGAGRTTPYGGAVSGWPCELIGVDLLREDLAANKALTQRIVHNVATDGIPKEVYGAGLISSRMVLEHIPNLEEFAYEVYAALAPEGRTIHLFAGRYSLFALVNRLLPESIARSVLFSLRPDSVEVGGFKTFYDKTHAPAAAAAFRRAGMVNVEVRISYQVSQYFRFLFPLYVIARLWETALHHLKLASAGSYVLLLAIRPGINGLSNAGWGRSDDSGDTPPG